MPVYVAEDALIRQVLGFKFHTGVIAVGRRLPGPMLAEIFEGRSGPMTLVVCPEISNSDNMGSLVRVSAAFGADAMVLGEKCHDPFWRQSIRVSMGRDTTDSDIDVFLRELPPVVARARALASGKA